MAGEDDERDARPRAGEVTSATFSYVDAMLTGRLSNAEFGRIRDEILGESAPEDVAPDPDQGWREAPRGRSPVDDEAVVERIEDRIAVQDYGAAMVAAEELLARRPDHDVAKRLLERCQGTLASAYQRGLGSGADVPALTDSPLPELDRWAGYLVSLIDGRSCIDTLVDTSGFTRLDTLRLLFELVQRGVVRIQPKAAARGDAGVAVARIRLNRVPDGET